jgi:putative transposase
LKRLGLVKDRRRRRRIGHPGRPVTDPIRPNQLWTADYKGQFKTRDARYCYPLTVADLYSRYLLGCRALSSTKTLGTRSAFQRLFREYGLPEAIRTDNGTPFSSATAIGRLSRLSVWWIRLGIRPELTQPSHPEQNGSHERMHRTLKAETTRPPSPTARLSNAPSNASVASTTTSAPTNTSTRDHPPRSTHPPPGPTPIVSPSPSTPDTSKSDASAAMAASAGKEVGSTSATPCSRKTLDSRRSPTESGRSTSDHSCSAGSTRTNSSSTEPDSIDQDKICQI